MRFANDILELNTWSMSFGRDPRGQLSGMKKLLAKGENGKFWASDFDISGAEMCGLSYLSVIKETGVTKEVEFKVEQWLGGEETRIVIKKGIVKQWELVDYEKLKRAYELIMELIKL